MEMRKLRLPITEDKLLPRTLTERFIDDLNLVLDDNADDFRCGYLSTYWLTKYCGPDPSEAKQRRVKAINKWLLTEERNHVTNVRLTSGADHLWFSERKTFGDVLERARMIVADIIGVAPSLDLLSGGFSGGATTSRRRTEGHPALKFLGKADATRPAYQIWQQLIAGTRWADHWAEAGLDARFVQGNSMFTVPKNAEIDRVACKEPDLNLFLQKSLGNQIRWCLRRVGINLNDQRRNGELARIGSIDGSLMTLDLSSASDSVTTELVRRLLPADWFWYLDCYRSPITEIDGVSHVNAMFSSMGNGFTFELESLLFYALTRAVAYIEGVRGTISVYGDDIIAPCSLYEPLVRALAFAGFQTNTSKSFHEGPFRESCGAYWDAGIDVKPFFLRGPLHRISDLILILNQLTRWSSDLGIYDPRFEDLFVKYRQYIPSDLWGGQDLTSRTSLVTGHTPRKALQPVTKLKSHTHVGGLLFWLFVAFDRLGFVDDPLKATESIATGLSRKRRNRQLIDVTLPFFNLKGLA